MVIERTGELVSDPYIEITRRCMALFGVDVAWPEPRRLEIPNSALREPGPPRRGGRRVLRLLAGLAAGAIGGAPVRVEGVGAASMQGDVAFADVLEAMGATITRRRRLARSLARGRCLPARRRRGPERTSPTPP